MASGIPYNLLISKLTPIAGKFVETTKIFDDMSIFLDYVMGTEFNADFEGFTLNFRPYRGSDTTTLSLDYNLSKDGHPLNDPVIGVARGTITISSGSEIIDYFNFYINISEKEKIRIRIEKI